MFCYWIKKKKNYQHNILYICTQLYFIFIDVHIERSEIFVHKIWTASFTTESPLKETSQSSKKSTK